MGICCLLYFFRRRRYCQLVLGSPPAAILEIISPCQIMDLNQVTVPCIDYETSVRFYKKLGLRQIVDSPPRYARFETDAGSTFSIHRVVVTPSRSDIIVYFEVDDLNGTVKSLVEQGVSFDTEPQDQDWLWREARLSDPAGNRLCIYQAGENRRHPPWRIDDGAA